eukprot:472127-Rhodomonas_salina.1
MELCVHKCEIAAHDFSTGKDLSTHCVRYAGHNLTPLASDKAVRYLGLRLDSQGSTEGERTHVITRMKDMAQRMKNHPYTYRQGFSL